MKPTTYYPSAALMREYYDRLVLNGYLVETLESFEGRVRRDCELASFICYRPRGECVERISLDALPAAVALYERLTELLETAFDRSTFERDSARARGQDPDDCPMMPCAGEAKRLNALIGDLAACLHAAAEMVMIRCRWDGRRS